MFIQNFYLIAIRTFIKIPITHEQLTRTRLDTMATAISVRRGDRF